MKLSRSISEYQLNHGWSSMLFADKAQQLFRDCESLNIKVDVGRSVIHLSTIKTIKLYVHRNASKEYMSICDEKGKELYQFHYTEPYEVMLTAIKHSLEI